MKSAKMMLLGIVLMLVGVGMMPQDTSMYISKNLGTNFLTHHYILISLVLLFVGFLVGVVGFFLKE